jgi:quercetin dioxygenase-like cupin family protein
MPDADHQPSSDPGDSPKRRMRVFRAGDSAEVTTKSMPLENLSDADAAAMSNSEDQIGAFVKVLFADEAAQTSLAYSWFKPNFILPKHSHNADCTYYIISGEAHLGSEVLRAGDGFFVPAGGNYKYSAGPEGVEVLEFRTATVFNMRMSGNTEADWVQIMQAARENHAEWMSAAPPLAARRMMG